MSNIIQVFRTEKKYFINHKQIINLRNILDLYMKKDLNSSSSGGYSVRSLYFDSYLDTDYFNKVAGKLFRKKIRLRIYGTDSKIAKLELKEKEGSNQRKRSLLLNKKDASKIARGDYSPLLEINDEVALYLYGIMQKELYKPKCLVEYKRLAYVTRTNDTRITFDTDIRYSFTNFKIFDEKVVLIPVNNNPIIEVKYNEFLLQPIKNAVNAFNLTECAISKYVIARQDKK